MKNKNSVKLSDLNKILEIQVGTIIINDIGGVEKQWETIGKFWSRIKNITIQKLQNKSKQILKSDYEIIFSNKNNILNTIEKNLNESSCIIRFYSNNEYYFPYKLEIVNDMIITLNYKNYDSD